MEYAIHRTCGGTVEEAVQRLGAELSGRGFGILADLRVDRILREKVGAEIAPLAILDVCSPRFAQRALASDPAAALVLPCKIVVAQEPSGVRLSLVRPTAAIAPVGPSADMRLLAEEAESLLRAAVDAAAAGGTARARP